MLHFTLQVAKLKEAGAILYKAQREQAEKQLRVSMQIDALSKMLRETYGKLKKGTTASPRARASLASCAFDSARPSRVFHCAAGLLRSAARILRVLTHRSVCFFQLRQRRTSSAVSSTVRTPSCPSKLPRQRCRRRRARKISKQVRHSLGRCSVAAQPHLQQCLI